MWQDSYLRDGVAIWAVLDGMSGINALGEGSLHIGVRIEVSRCEGSSGEEACKGCV